VHRNRLRGCSMLPIVADKGKPVQVCPTQTRYVWRESAGGHCMGGTDFGRVVLGGLETARRRRS